jgi:hypothetical protein
VKRSCLAWAGVYLLIALGLGVWFDASVREPVSDVSPPPAWMPSRAWLVIGGTLAGALPGLFAVSMVASAATRLKERVRLRRSGQGLRPRDGERGVVFGRIMREGPSLTAPVSGRECVLYRYQIAHTESRSSTRRDGPSPPSRTVVDAEGFALAPSVIQTATGLVKLRSFVKPEFKADRFTMSDVGARVDAYLAAATFRGRGSLEDEHRALQAVLEDGDGAIRYDRGSGRIDPGVSPWLEEHVVLNGDEVCVFGRYSAAQGAIVPDPDGPALLPTRLRKGSLGFLSRRLELDGVGYGLGAAAWAALAAAWAFAFPIFGPSLW